MNIKGVDFPEALLNALRDEKLVVFAGAGVSMGAPANLPSFPGLAKQVAEGTGESVPESNIDRFLGRLKNNNGTEVHQIAAGCLQPDNLEPNALHRNLLRLFKETSSVRVVTTNFDGLFEAAAEAKALFKAKPKVFEAPALPLGSRFQGIVHLHGSVNEPEEMVLTDRDFGRAYLTEADGWARRFLVGLFSTYTVLFVGYSHEDTIMTYLTPSLPPDGEQKRFALVGSNDDQGHWRRMGIEPVVFLQASNGNFTSLDTAMKGLADFRRRSFIGWQQEIVRIASRLPPQPNIDDEGSHTIDHALTRVDLTLFFVKAAKDSEWITWLDGRGHLKRLFMEGELEVKDKILSHWLADQFIRDDSELLFSIILRYNGKVSQHFRNALLRQLAISKENPLKPQILSRWVHILTGFILGNSNGYVLEFFLLNLAEHCAKAGNLQSLLQVYDVMTARLIWFLPGLDQGRDNHWNYLIKELWQRSLEPNLPHIAYTLLKQSAMRLEQRHSAIIAWNQDNDKIDSDSFFRPAIESHEQDKSPYRISPLIDVARGCLEWLVINEPETVGTWCDRFIQSNLPLLRRLAIHAIDVREDLSANDKMTWLLKQCDVNNVEARHEILRMTAHVYPQASRQQREALIQAISQYQAPAESDNHVEQSVDHQFNWFQCLHTADPDCSLAKAELDKIRVQYSQPQPREHLVTQRTKPAPLTTPWTVEELLAKPASEWLSDLSTYQPHHEEEIPSGKNRLSMLSTVREASERNTAWGLDLADAMAEKSAWDYDLWECLIFAWEKAKLDPETMKRMPSYLSINKQLCQYKSSNIADILRRLAKEGASEGDVTEFLSKLNSVATALYPYAAATEYRRGTWLWSASYHPSGKLALFWMDSIALWRKQQPVPPQALNSEYRCALDTIVDDNGISGKLGRTVLASKFHFLHHVDSTWTEQHLLPLFDTKHEDFQCAWDGYLTCGRLSLPISLPIAELLKDKCIGGLQRAIQDFPGDTLERFIQFYVSAMSLLIKNAKDKWISEFFKHTRENTHKNLMAKHMFALQVGHLLRNLDERQQQKRWNIWLKNYWKNRLQGVPCSLDDKEIAKMLEWVIHLQGVFPEAVAMAVKAEPATLDNHSSLVHQISQSNLTDRYPNEMAQFLIYLGKCKIRSWCSQSDKHSILDVCCRLLEKGLSEELKQGLHETMLRIEAVWV